MSRIGVYPLVRRSGRFPAPVSPRHYPRSGCLSSTRPGRHISGVVPVDGARLREPGAVAAKQHIQSLSLRVCMIAAPRQQRQHRITIESRREVPFIQSAWQHTHLRGRRLQVDYLLRFKPSKPRGVVKRHGVLPFSSLRLLFPRGLPVAHTHRLRRTPAQSGRTQRRRAASTRIHGCGDIGRQRYIRPWSGLRKQTSTNKHEQVNFAAGSSMNIAVIGSGRVAMYEAGADRPRCAGIDGYAMPAASDQPQIAKSAREK